MAVTLAQGFLVLLGFLQVVPIAITTGVPPTHPFAKIIPSSRSPNSVDGGQGASDPHSDALDVAFSRQLRKLYSPRSVSGIFEVAIPNPPPRDQLLSIDLGFNLKTLFMGILVKGIQGEFFKHKESLVDSYTPGTQANDTSTTPQGFGNDTSTDHHLNPANHTTTNATTTTTQDPFSGSPDPNLTSPHEEGTLDDPIAKEESQKSTLNSLRRYPDRKFPSYGRVGRYRRQAAQSNENGDANSNGNGNGNGNGSNSTVTNPATVLLNRLRDNFDVDNLSVKILTEQVLNAAFTSTSSVIYFLLNRLGLGQFMSTGELVVMMWTMYDATAVFVQWISADNTESNN